MSCLVTYETKMTSGLSEVWVICDGIFSCLSRSTVINQYLTVESSPTEQFLGLLLGSSSAYPPGYSVGVSAITDPLADHLSGELEDLIMSPVIASLAQCPGATAQDVLEGTCLGTKGSMPVFLLRPIRTSLKG